MPLNQTSRGRFGTTITEAAMFTVRNTVFRNRVNNFQWAHIDDDEPAEPMMPNWNAPGANKLNMALLWEIVGPAGSSVGTDQQLQGHLIRELENREKVWQLMKAAVAAVQSGLPPTPFMSAPLVEAKNAGCKKITGDPIDLFDLMLMMHMFGKQDVPEAPRPMNPIRNPDDYFYRTEAEVATEVRRRVNELAAGITWEGNVTGGKEKKKVVWNRHGLYCGCG